MEKDRIQSLDLVKIVAMLMVLMLHVNVFKDWSRTGSTGAYYALAGIAIPLLCCNSFIIAILGLGLILWLCICEQISFSQSGNNLDGI